MEETYIPYRNDDKLVGAQYQAVSWGSIIAGVVVAIGLQLLFNLLGFAIGASSINASQGDQPGKGMAVGALIWFVVTWLLSLGAGAWTATQFSGHTTRRLAALNGVLIWAVASLSLVYLLGTAAGSLIGGTASVIGRAASLAGSGAKSSAPAVTGLLQQATGVTPKDISDQAGDLVSDPKFQQILGDALRGGQFTDEDHQALATLLEQRRHMTPDQADQTISQWQSDLKKAAQSAKTNALQAEDKAASGVSAAGFGSFIALLLGLAAAVLGGVLGKADPSVVLASERRAARV
jgi:hypothetical protein